MNYYIYERLFENQNKFQNLKDQVNYTFRELYRIVRYAIFEKIKVCRGILHSSI